MLNSDFTTSFTRPVQIEPFSRARVDGGSREQALFDAITNHDRAVINTILAQPGLDLSQRNPDGQTPLQVAADLGDADTVVALIRYYRDDKAVLQCDGDRWQASVQSAAPSEGPTLPPNDFRFLDAQDRNGFSALMLAGKKGHVAAVQVLLDAGADVDDTVVRIGLPYARAAQGKAAKTIQTEFMRARNSPGRRSRSLEFDDTQFAYTTLMLVTEHGQPLVVDQLLNAGAKHTPQRRAQLGNYSFSLTYTPLMLAAAIGDVESAKRLLAAGASPNFSSMANVQSPLTVASRYDQPEMIHYLIDSGVNVNAKPRRGHFPLAAAAQAGSVRAIKALCSRGARIDPPGSERLTALHRAAKRGHAVALETLLDLKANINAIDPKGRSALMHAVEAHHPAAVTVLINRGALDSITPNTRQEMLVYAAEHNSVELISALLKTGLDVDKVDDVGMTPLLIAAKLGHLPAMQTLLDAGANIEARGKNGYTPMAMAALSNQAGAIRFLQSKQASLEARTAQQTLPPNLPLATPHLSGKTPLLLAAEAGCLASVATLVELGADINARDHHGSTPLTLATERRHIDVIEWLIEKGANLELRNADKDTPFMIAFKARDHKLMGRLRDAGANINAVDINAGPTAGNSPVLTAIEANDMETLMLLLQWQTDVNQVNAAGISPLRAAIEYDRPEMIRALYVYGADVDAPDRNGMTPFMAASRLNQVDTMRFLAQANANIHATTAGGQDARTLAIRAGAREAQDCLVRELGWIAPASRAPGRAR